MEKTELVEKLLAAAKIALCLLVLGFVASYVATNWQALEEVQTPLISWLVLGSVMAIAGLLGFAWTLRVLIRSHGIEISFARAIGLFFVPTLGKYVPGKVWAIFGALWLHGREGIPKSVAAACIGLSMTLGLLSATLAAVLAEIGAITAIMEPWLLAMIAIALLAGIHPRIFYPTVNRALQVIGRQPIVASLAFPTLLRLLAVNVFAWVLSGIGFWCLVRSMFQVPISSLPHLVSLFAIAQIIGFLALFAPAGIGVREGVLIVGLQPLVGPGPAIVITGVCRLWQTAIELLLAGVGWWALRKPVAKVEGTDNP